MILHEKTAFGPTKLMIHMGNAGYHLFDPGYDNVFYARAGRLASLDELREDLTPVRKAKHRPMIHGVPYVSYFSGVYPVSRFRWITRADLQMPSWRLLYEFLRLMGFKRDFIVYE